MPTWLEAGLWGFGHRDRLRRRRAGLPGRQRRAGPPRRPAPQALGRAAPLEDEQSGSGAAIAVGALLVAFAIQQAWTCGGTAAPAG